MGDSHAPKRSPAPARSRLWWVAAACLAVCPPPLPLQEAGTPALPTAVATLPADAQANISRLQDDLRVAQSKGDTRSEAKAQISIGNAYLGIPRYQDALDAYHRALALAQQIKDADLEAQALNRIGIVEDEVGHSGKAREYYHQALEKWRAANDIDGQAKTLGNLGILSSEMSRPPEALAYYNQAMLLYRKAGDRAGEAGVLNSLGILYRNTGDNRSALAVFEKARPLFHDLGDLHGEAVVLDNIGNASSGLGQNPGALKAFNESLAIHRRLNDAEGQAGVLVNVAGVWMQLGEMNNALAALQQALRFWTSASEPRGEADTLNAIGVLYDNLGQLKPAADYYQRALTLFNSLQDSRGAAAVLIDLAGIYGARQQDAKALGYLDQALKLESQAEDPDGEARALNNRGLVFEDLGQKDKALASYQQALPIWHKAGNRDGEAQVLDNIGSLLADSGHRSKARSYFVQALGLAAAVGDPTREAQIFHNMMRNEKASNPAQAVFCGKKAVNLLQQVRGNIQGMDMELQRSFLASKYDYYRDLADLLIAQGRLPEAEQVLDLLKQQEYTDYVRGNPARMLSPLALTPAELQAEADYQRSTVKLIAEDERWRQLKERKARTPEEDREFEQLTQELSNGRESLNAFYIRLHKLFAATGAPGRSLAEVKGDVSVLKDQIARTPHAVGLRTVVTEKTYSVIVVTAGAAVARQYPISRAELNRKIAAFQQVLRNPAQDPKPLAQDLYKILMGPVQSDLDQAHAQTLIWTLDDTLRYISMAALYDGKQYMIEKYNMASITTASYPHLGEPPQMDKINALAMGISRKYQDDLNPLPTVVSELEGIVRDPGTRGADGVLPGTILLNNQFTEKAMEDQLDGKHAIVHIASHFVLQPGDDEASYLLLAGKETAGAGYHLTLADFRDNPNLSLKDTELLTLSACDTGVGSTANGVEVDGLASTAQSNGAQAVISSLWQVNDASTGNLMADFYKRWANGGGAVMKVEALRQAQLDLLEGKVKPKPDYADENAPASFAHPYYWAAFVLTGNWR